MAVDISFQPMRVLIDGHDSEGRLVLVAFVFNTKLNRKTNVDKLTDFSVRDDTIELENAIFKKVGAKTCTLRKDFFRVGDKAKDGNDYVIYDKKKGMLYYDADGSGHDAAVQYATIQKNLKMTYKDLFVI